MQQQSFTHHGQHFTIEAEGWPNEEAACAAIIDLQIWVLHLEPEETAGLHGQTADGLQPTVTIEVA